MEYLLHRIKLAKLFGQEQKLPTTPEECRSWFIGLAGDLSPENLTCDGELSRAEVNKKLKDINRAWAYLEQIYGRKVEVDEAEGWMMEDWRNNREKNT